MYYTKNVITLFTLLGILLIPFSWNLFTFHKEFMIWIFQPILRIIEGFSGISFVMYDLSSDSRSLYFLIAFILLLSVILAVPFTLWYNRHRAFFFEFTRSLAICFLSAVMMKYGFDKVFKTQFYLPEPNLLYTPMGNLDKDILFWSTMGSSYSYNLFMGSMELLPAFLILFKRTRIIGLIISLGVFVNVMAINLSFDISVKLFVYFLLVVNLYLLIPYAIPLWKILSQNKPVTINTQTSRSFFDHSNFWKIILLVLIMCEAISPYTKSGNFQDDHAIRPPLHGVYKVISITNMEGSILSNEPTYKRMFVHRDGFLIFQDQNDKMIDLKMNIDSDRRRLELIDYDGHTTYGSYQESRKDSTLMLKIKQNDQIIFVQTKQLDWRELPLLQSQFHWTVD